MKRIFDFLFSLILILVLSPLLIPIVILLLLTGEHYVFFKQQRAGYKGRHFGLYKFATMLKDSPNLGSKDTVLPNDFRVLPMGKFLRKSKINEIPQLLNVLIGDMSFVGPRPLTLKHFKYYTADQQLIISQMKPGITGIGSIVFRDEERILKQSKLPWEQCVQEVIMPYKAALEIWYFDHKSFLTDLKLLFITAWVVFFKESEMVYKTFKDLPKRNF